MAHLNDFAPRFRKGLASASPFASLGLKWCPRCQDEVTCRTQTAHRGTTYLHKLTCGRCGQVIQHGVFQNVPLLGARPLDADEAKWIAEPGEDRR